MTQAIGERVESARFPASSPPRSALDTRWVERLAATAGLACLVWWGADAVATARFQRDSARAFDAARTAPRTPDAGIRARLEPPSGRRTPAAVSGPRVLGRIEIPAARVSVMIAAGTDPHTLGLAVGHVSGTALPGESGRCVLAGHRDGFFRGLGQLRPGDRIRITTRTSVTDYRVTSARIVTRQTVEALEAGPAPGVVLVTCYPFHFVGPAPLRYVVYAEALRPSATLPLRG